MRVPSKMSRVGCVRGRCPSLGAARRSPLRLCKHLFDPEWLDPGDPKFRTEWHAVGPVRAAKFRCAERPEWFAVLSPSAKEPGRWQLSTFDEQGPWGDVIRDTPDQAIKDGLDGYGCKWMLEAMVTPDGVRCGRKSR